MVNLSHYFASWVQWEVQEGQSACAACPHHLKTVRFQSSNFNSMLLISLGLSPPGGAFSNAWGSDRDNLRKKRMRVPWRAQLEYRSSAKKFILLLLLLLWDHTHDIFFWPRSQVLTPHPRPQASRECSLFFSFQFFFICCFILAF